MKFTYTNKYEILQRQIMIKKRQKKTNQNIYILCLNPNCPKPSERCLDGHSMRVHPSECSKHYYPTDTILQNFWTKISDYPNDPLGIAVKKKTLKNQSQGYLDVLINEFKNKIMKIIDKFSDTLKQIYPSSCLEDKFIDIYSLQRIQKALEMQSSSEYINNAINNNLSAYKYQQLLRMNTKIDQIDQSLDNICVSVRKTLNEILSKTEQNQALKKTLPENFDAKVHYGLLKSKYIGSSKISCEKGIVIFPKMENIVSFLPWVYCEKSFSTGVHNIKIHALKFPLVSNCGLAVLQEHDIDTYPYHFFKSLYNKQGRGFTLIEGSEMEHIIGETATIVLKLDLGSNSFAQIYDTQRRSKYQCKLVQNRSYRVAIYGSGWATQIIELS